MTRVASILLCLGLVCASGVAAGFERAVQQYPAMQESLRHVPPKYRAGWLRSRGLDDSYYTTYRAPTDSGLRLVGKYGRGPSVEVTGHDSLVFLRLGSEVAIINFAALDSPQVIAELQLDYVWGQVAVRETLLITGGNGIDIWSVADPRNPRHISTIQYAVGDFALSETLVHFVSLDTFQTFSIADPAHPYRLGFCPESGYATTATCSTVVLVHDGHLSFVDVSNPTAPHTAGTFTGAAFSAVARGGLCCASFLELPGAERTWFLTLDISNPSAPRQLARLDSIFGYDLYLADSLVFVSGRSAAYPEKFRIVSIADSAHPKLKGTCGVSDYRWGVWANPASNRAFVASEPGGLAVIDISNQSTPTVDTTLMHADLAYDISVDGTRAYVADWRGGLRILDVSNPACPTELGGYDSASIASNTAVASDSFAFVGWYQTPYFLSVDVSDPASPKHVGGTAVQTIPEDMVLRDSFVYLAGRLRFNVVNVARPHEPVLVGSCVLGGDVWDLDVEDTMAYVTSNVFTMVNIARPDSPRVTATWNAMVAVDVEDTIAYTIGSGAVWAVSVARPTQPYVLDTVGIPDWKSDVVVGESLLFAGGQTLYVIDKRDPRNLRVVGHWTPPQEFRRLLWTPAYLYAACYEAGVCILETVPVGLEEPQEKGGTQASIRLSPSVTTGPVTIMAGRGKGRLSVRLYDGSGARVGEPAIQGKLGATTVQLDLSGYPDGVYFVNLQGHSMSFTMKVVKAKRR